MLVQIHTTQKLVEKVRWGHAQKWLKMFLGGHALKGCGQSGDRTLKVTLSGGWTDEVD